MDLDLIDVQFDLKNIKPRELEEAFEDPFLVRFIPDNDRSDGLVRYYALGRTVADRYLFFAFWTDGKSSRVVAAREMAELPAEVEAHVLPAGGTSTKDDNPLGFRDFSTVEHRIDASYAATADYLDDWVIPREDEDQRRPPGERRPDPER